MPKQTSATTGSELFIVDNSHPDWQAQRYHHDQIHPLPLF